MKGGGIKLLKQAEQIKGFIKLTEQEQKQFKQTLDRFYSGWEFPEDWQPIEVFYVAKDPLGNGNYLRVNFTRKRWLHFAPNGTWY